jgi:pimeloyl-ACP methyl ester carboxylesterase
VKSLPDFPYRRHVLDLDGLEYAYVDEGTGPPVILVHGNPSWSYLYRSLLAVLPADGFRALAPDHIGMGRSAKPDRSAYAHTLASRVEDFRRWMDAVCPTGPVTLVVHDWGGAIALAWAVDHPQRVTRLVLLNTAAFPLPAGKGLPLALRATRAPVLGSAAVYYANAFAFGATVLGVRRWMPKEIRRGFLAPYDTPAHRVAVLEFVRDIPVRPGDPAYPILRRTEERLPTLAGIPILICWGMRDFVLDGDILAHWETIFPAAEVHRFPHAGHYVLEDAGVEIVPLLRQFLRADASSLRG